MTRTTVDLEQELRKEQEGTASWLVKEANELLRVSEAEESDIWQRIQNGSSARWNVDPSGLDGDRIFSGSTIHRTCTKYRLRFLPTPYFKDKIPYEAIQRVRELESRTGVRIEQFRIMAPEQRFELEDSMKDPLLFAPLGNGQFYLIYKWGNELSAFRKFWYFPFRNARSLLVTSVILAFLMVTFLPADMIGGETTTVNLAMLKKVFMAAILTIFFFTMALITGITTARDFSSDQWNSKFFN